MLNMERVGRKISELRRERNMTQMELADQMGISFQAVSNWERGNSMPDISKLPELAGLFGVSIDELLGEKSELVESLTKDGGKIYLEANPITPEELSEVAPILKPDQVDEVFEKLEVSDLKEIEDLLPFIGGSVVDNILLKAAESGDGRDLDIVAPFAGKDALGKAAVKLYQRFGMRGDRGAHPLPLRGAAGGHRGAGICPERPAPYGRAVPLSLPGDAPAPGGGGVREKRPARSGRYVPLFEQGSPCRFCPPRRKKGRHQGHSGHRPLPGP